LLLSESHVERWACTRALVACSWAGKRPREWEEAWTAAATRLHDRSRAEAGACMLAYLWAADHGEGSAAEAYLSRAEHATRGWWRRRLRRVVLVEQAFFEALYRGDPAAARARLESAGRPAIPRHLRRRAGAALALASRDAAAAERIASAALEERQRIATRVGAGIATLEEEWLRQIASDGVKLAVAGMEIPIPATEEER
ncbi:MAG TPA: hypothetical protein VGR27_05755, partial [Longimicrobiaceae bacterium]|nr:hypothetical protein [Longimicrobiaceae bacterium]